MTTPETSIVKPASVGLKEHYFPIDNNNIPTPPIAIQALNTIQPLKDMTVWECAVGEGYMARALENFGADVYGSDIRKIKDGHKIYGTDGVSIETSKWPKDADLIITNPPYGALLRPFIAALTRWMEQSNCPDVWFLLAQHTMMSQWVHEDAGHLLRGYYPFVFGLPYLKNGKWEAGGAFKHAWTRWQKPSQIDSEGTKDGGEVDCQFITRKWLQENS